MKADSQKYIANTIYICMLSKTLWLIFAFQVLVSGVVPYTEDPRMCLRLPKMDLTEMRRAGHSQAFKSWKTSLYFTATTSNLCFIGIQFLEVADCIFGLQIFFLVKALIRVDFPMDLEAGWKLNRVALASHKLLAPWPRRSISGFKGVTMSHRSPDGGVSGAGLAVPCVPLGDR